MREHAPNGIVTPVTCCCAIYLSVYIFVDFHCNFFFSTGSGVAWVECIQTRVDTRPIPVADGWAGVEMRVLTLSNLITTDQRTNGPKDGQTDGQSLRFACPQLECWLTE